MNSRNSLKFLILLTLLTVLVGSSCKRASDKEARENLYNQIDEEIERVEIYEEEKEKRIEDLKERISTQENSNIKRELTYLLINEFESYISDSALHYINQNLNSLPQEVSDKERTNLLIKKADVTAHAGLFNEAAEILKGIDRQSLDSVQLESYFSAYCDLYQYQSEYTSDSEFGRNNELLRQQYIDSISKVASPSSFNYVVNNAAEAARNGKFEEAEKILNDKISQYKSGNRNYSILASILADIYKQKGDKNNYHKYLSLAVISDIQGAIKENMAIRALATICYEEGDLERADKYLRQSFADANFYSARMRNAQSSRMLPIIGDAYVSQQKHMNHELTLFIIFISLLALGFIIISVFAFKQVKKVRRIHKQTKSMYDEVSALSRRLKEVNEKLQKANNELIESDKIKGEYGVLFMEYCSLAISSLQQYQQSLIVASTQGNFKTLQKKIESPNLTAKTLAEFYNKFDEAILNIYPNYIDNFNNLLLPDERIILKPGESLNTELRIFALMKIGIADPEKIAQFLRCSLSTVYTYRSKIKKKALNPDTFEDEIMLI